MATITEDQADARVIPNLCARDIITAALSTMGKNNPGTNNEATLASLVPIFREVLEEINNSPYLLPSFKYKKLATLNTNQTSYTWGIGGDIDLPYPQKIARLFTASDNLNTGAGETAGGDAFTNSTIFYLTEMDRQEFISSRYTDPGYATRYWLERERPLHTIFFNGNPVNSGANTLYGIVKLALLIPQESYSALSYPIEVEEGHREWMRLSLALKIASRYGITEEVKSGWRYDKEMVMEQLSRRQEKPQTITSKYWNDFRRGTSSSGSKGFGTSRLEGFNVGT